MAIQSKITFTKEIKLESPQTQLTLEVLKSFVDTCYEGGFTGDADLEILVNPGDQRDPAYVQIIVSS